MKLIKSKKGDLLGNVFVVFITLFVFFALYPAVKSILDLAISVNAGTDPVADFLIGSVGFVMLFGMIKWIYNSVSGSGASEWNDY